MAQFPADQFNDGWHFFHDDAFYTFDQASIDVYLEIYKQGFVKANQEANYDMMMGAQSSRTQGDVLQLALVSANESG